MTEATITVLNSDQRRFLDAQTQRARAAAQRAAEDALRALAVGEPSRPAYLGEEQNGLRLALRDKGRQLGDDTSRAGAPLTNLVHDVAYEQWHRLLFARFLEVNELLRHPEYRDIPLSLEDCGDFAPDLGEPDAWAVAARFASEILPGVFRLTDPAVEVRFAAEHRNALERLLLEIPAEVFTTEDALGWVYQFWQTAEKKRVNDSGVKIGGADLSPVTQLFTENYMVRFLLENSLGAWWAARHPESPLIASWEYLRRNEDGTPIVGSFSDWPEQASHVTVMDPCCGSGHFLVAMFGMLWRMRAEEDGLSPAEAQDAVLRDNLHGLELDPRCTQIATFNVALEAWKQGGFRDLPAPQIACSGVPVRGMRQDWESLAGDDDELRKAMYELHTLFRNADSLGSLIDPRPTDHRDGLFGRDLSVGVSADRVRGLLTAALRDESEDTTVLGHAADEVMHAAGLLGRSYTLVATNPPYLSTQRMDEVTAEFIADRFPRSSTELATAMLERYLPESTGTIAAVMPMNWLFLKSFSSLRVHLLHHFGWNAVAPLGAGAFQTITGQVVQSALVLVSTGHPKEMMFVDARQSTSTEAKAEALRIGDFDLVALDDLRKNPGSVLDASTLGKSLLSSCASSWQGLVTMDTSRYVLHFWEVTGDPSVWERYVTAPSETGPSTGRQYFLRWDSGNGALRASRAHNYNPSSVLGKRGVLVGQSSLRVTLYNGEMFNDASAPVIPLNPDDLGAVWQYLQTPDYAEAVRRLNSKVVVNPGYLIKVPFDRDHWRQVAENVGTTSLSNLSDPTQWTFSGSTVGSNYPLQVAVAGILGFRWPDQDSSAWDALADADGIAALVSLPGEPDLVTRLREFLAVAYGSEWSSARERKLVVAAGGKNGRLEDWLRDQFFAQHVKVFDNRPFLWHIWDGRKDGFSAIINYHRLDRRTLEKLTFTSLGAWIDRQKHEARAERASADARLAAAEDLQRRLKLILEGAPPYDIYVRWKPLAEQAIGWEPDLDDGVRLNIRPFVAADVLRSKVNVHWRKDRGTNPDRSERHNDLHPTLAERRAARKAAEDAE
ncbi:hypothetical protein [Mycetocola zhujimingii]|uniref:site-specific DNA-methyltransferase (adenine-specific) n=1 Tax=Mycetocola zhujimingii TaxID=2079792 RepID=A0A2U1TC98_9MICO|nr:hypothetical protein [Mycetocola zhujimingii]PWC06430.1 hypothetical protein DF223_12625 [Mycetocola zhujimingii]